MNYVLNMQIRLLIDSRPTRVRDQLCYRSTGRSPGPRHSRDPIASAILISAQRARRIGSYRYRYRKAQGGAEQRTEDLSVGGQLGDNVEEAVGLDHLIEANDVCVPQTLQERHFAAHSGQTRSVQSQLVDHFHRHLCAVNTCAPYTALLCTINTRTVLMLMCGSYGYGLPARVY